MRNDNLKWPPTQATDALSNDAIDLGSVLLTPIQITSQTLISGPKVLVQMDGPLIGWPDKVNEENYTLCLRRDRVLAVNETTVRESGWDEQHQLATSDVSDTYQVFDLSGPGAFDLLQRGAELDVQTPSRSVVRLLFGMEVMLYRMNQVDHFRVHVSMPRQQSLVQHLQEAAS